MGKPPDSLGDISSHIVDISIDQINSHTDDNNNTNITKSNYNPNNQLSSGQDIIDNGKPTAKPRQNSKIVVSKSQLKQPPTSDHRNKTPTPAKRTTAPPTPTRTIASQPVPTPRQHTDKTNGLPNQLDHLGLYNSNSDAENASTNCIGNKDGNEVDEGCDDAGDGNNKSSSSPGENTSGVNAATSPRRTTPNGAAAGTTSNKKISGRNRQKKSSRKNSEKSETNNNNNNKNSENIKHKSDKSKQRKLLYYL